MHPASPRDSLSSATVRMHLAKMSVRPSIKGMYRLVPAPMAKKALEADIDAAEATESATPEKAATSTVSMQKKK